MIGASTCYQWRIQDFSEVGRQSSGGAPTYNFAKFPPKLNEIKRIWTPGGACVPRLPLLLRYATGYEAGAGSRKMGAGSWNSSSTLIPVFVMTFVKCENNDS